MKVVMLGSKSDIAKELTARFMVDGHSVIPWCRGEKLPVCEWDVVVCAIGVLSPIGKFFDTNSFDWAKNIASNVITPLSLLKDIWPQRNPQASVCFFSGAGVSRPAPTYSAYASSKAMLMKMTELLDDEYPEKFFILGPGMVKTKIQNQTLEAGVKADNFERVKTFMEGVDQAHGKGTSHDRIYECLKWCIGQPKEVVGGRNFYVPGTEWGDSVSAQLRANKDIFKLRRFGGGL